MSNEIHPTAIINSKAELGDNISVGPYTVVEGDVVIDNGTQLGPHVYCADESEKTAEYTKGRLSRRFRRI